MIANSVLGGSPSKIKLKRESVKYNGGGGAEGDLEEL